MSFMLAAGVVLPLSAQDADSPGQPPSSGWRRLGDSAPAAAEAVPPAAVPADLTVPAGSWISVRVNQVLSSDHNQPGDAFMGTLAQPVVANGFVIARRGQSVAGVVAVAEKAGRVKGTSRLGLELNEISLVDGRQVPVRSRLMEYGGGTSMGRDATAIGTTTGIGAAIGAVADGGFGAGMGAIAGAAASTIGVLVTRGRSTEVYPESVLTFRLEAPLTVPTGGSAGVFQPVSSQDYEQRTLAQRRPAPAPAPPYYYGYGYPYPYYWPYYYGPSFFFYSGPRFFGYGHGGYGHRGFRR